MELESRGWPNNYFPISLVNVGSQGLVGTQETSLALVWGEYGWVGSYSEVCPSRIWVGCGKTSMRD